MGRIAEDSEAIQPVLVDKEELLWTGHPTTKIRFKTADEIAIYIGVWTAIALLGSFLIPSIQTDGGTSVTGYTRGIDMAFLGIVALPALVALCLIIWSRAYDLFSANRTYYAVTNMRVLILSTFPKRNVESLKISPKLDVKKHISRKGIGRLILTHYDSDGTEKLPKWLNKALENDVKDRMEFGGLTDAKSVYSLIKSQIEASSAEQGSDGTDDEFPFVSDAFASLTGPPREVSLISKLAMMFSSPFVWAGWGAAVISAMFFSFAAYSEVTDMPGLVFAGVGASALAAVAVGGALSLSSLGRGLRLLAIGEASYGTLKRIKETHLNDHFCYDVAFVFTAHDGDEYQSQLYTQDTTDLTDQPHELILYNPANPSENVVVDDIPGRPQIDDSGKIHVERMWLGVAGLLAILALIAAFVFIIARFLHA